MLDKPRDCDKISKGMGGPKNVIFTANFLQNRNLFFTGPINLKAPN